MRMRTSGSRGDEAPDRSSKIAASASNVTTIRFVSWIVMFAKTEV